MFMTKAIKKSPPLIEPLEYRIDKTSSQNSTVLTFPRPPATLIRACDYTRGNIMYANIGEYFIIGSEYIYIPIGDRITILAFQL